MTKRTILTVVVVFVCWAVLDFILHGVLLRPTYEATANLWRPVDQMKMPLMYLATVIFSTCFVVIYAQMIGKKSLAAGIRFGFLFGLASGISMGFGSYSMMPIPLSLAWSWFIGTWIELIVAGAITGAMIRA